MRKNLERARQGAGMTRQQMADKAGISLCHYKKIEYGETDGPFAVWDALEDLLGIGKRRLKEVEGMKRHDKETNARLAYVAGRFQEHAGMAREGSASVSEAARKVCSVELCVMWALTQS